MGKITRFHLSVVQVVIVLAHDDLLKRTVMGGVREPIRLCSLRSPIDVRGSEWNDVLQRGVFDLRYDSNSVHMAAKLEIFYLPQHISWIELPGVVSDAILRPR